MCLGTVFMIYTDEEKEQLMPDVAIMEQRNGEVYLTDSEGETKVVPGRILAVDFLRSVIMIESLAESTGEEAAA